MALIKELVQCIAPAPDEPPKSAGQFKSALARVRSGGIIVAKVADELVASKHLQEAIADNNWSSFVSFIFKDNPEYKLADLSVAKAKEVVQDVVVRCIFDFCRSDNLEEATKDMKACTLAIRDALSKDEHPSLREDLVRLSSLLVAHEDLDEVAARELDNARDHLHGNKQGFFFKALTILPTGKALISTAANISNTITKQKRLARDLDSLTALCPQVPCADMLLKDGVLHFADADVWGGVHVRLAEIAANGTKAFLTSRAPAITDIKDKQKALVVVLVGAVKISWTALFGPVVQRFKSVFQDVESSAMPPAAAKKELDKLLEPLDPVDIVKKYDLEKLAPKDCICPLQTLIEDIRAKLNSVRDTLGLMLSAASGKALDLKDQSIISLAALLTEKKGALIATFGEHGKVLHDCLHPVILRNVARALQSNAESMPCFVLQLNANPAAVENAFSLELVGGGDGLADFPVMVEVPARPNDNL